MAPFLKDNSRLGSLLTKRYFKKFFFLKSNNFKGCQIVLKKDLDGIVLTLPKATRNFYIDGHVPEPH
jgi:hypothetical protein